MGYRSKHWTCLLAAVLGLLFASHSLAAELKTGSTGANAGNLSASLLTIPAVSSLLSEYSGTDLKRPTPTSAMEAGIAPLTDPIDEAPSNNPTRYVAEITSRLPTSVSLVIAALVWVGIMTGRLQSIPDNRVSHRTPAKPYLAPTQYTQVPRFKNTLSTPTAKNRMAKSG